MPSKLNYFTRKEERSIYKNRFVRLKKKIWVLKGRDSDSFFECEALKLLQ